MFGRTRKTHTQRMREEFVESYGHLKAATAHAAGAGAEVLTPPYDKARYVAGRGWETTKGALAPLYDTMKDGARNARSSVEIKVTQKNNKKWPVLAGLLATGAAVGVGAAMIARRHRATAQWDEYEPTRALDDADAAFEGARDEADKIVDTAAGKVSSATKKVTAGAAAVAETVSTQAGKLADTLHQKSSAAEKAVGEAVNAAGDGAEELRMAADRRASSFSAFADETADEMVARASSAGRNSRT